MLDNDRDSVEVPIELRFRKVAPEKDPLQLRHEKEPSNRRLRIDIELSLWSESHFYAGLSLEASQAGLFVATYRPLKPGESVLLRVEILGEWVEIEGVVRWGRVASEYAPPGVGVALRGLAPNARRLICAFCAQRVPIYYELENDDSQSR
jgi:Tfp pilus assembly protein PilZ